MPTTEKLSIALPLEMATIIRQAVEAGEYSSQSEVVHDALIGWSQKRNVSTESIAGLRKAWSEAVTDDSDGEDPAPILDTLELKYDALSETPGH